MKNINQFTAKFMRIRRKQVFKYFDLEDLILCFLIVASSGVLSFCFISAAHQVYERQQQLQISIQEPVSEI